MSSGSHSGNAFADRKTFERGVGSASELSGQVID
ncbi:hypothetical protein AB7M49_006615 [Bradyrhizobium elkanii]